jgi:hypothetical protein
MRRTTALLAVLLAVGGVASCSKSHDEKAKDCAVALAERTGGDPADTPTVDEAEERVDALDDTLASMVRTGHARLAGEAADAVEKKGEEGGKGRPEACESLSEDDYRVLLMAKAIGGLGWTDEDGQFDKLKMAEGLRG